MGSCSSRQGGRWGGPQGVKVENGELEGRSVMG